VRDLDPDRFDFLYRRTMSQIPMDDLADLMAGEGFGPLTAADDDRIDRCVTAGYKSWIETDKEFRERAERIRSLERGTITEADLEEFLLGSLGAEIEAGWRQRGFHNVEGMEEPQIVEHEARVFRMPNDVRGYLGRAGGVGLVNCEPGRPRPTRLGLNDPFVASQVRVRMGEAGAKAGEGVRGAGLILVPRGAWRDWASRSDLTALGDGAVLLAYVRRHLDMSTPSFREVAAEVLMCIASPDGEFQQRLTSESGADLMRLIRRPRPKRQRPAQLAGTRLQDVERQIAADLTTPEPGKPAVGLFPVAAIWIEPADE